MKQLRLLIFLLTSISIFGITNVHVSLADPKPTVSPLPSTSPTSSPVTIASPVSPKPRRNPQPDTNNMEWLFIPSGILHLVTLGGLIYFFLKSRNTLTKIDATNNLISKKIDKSERDSFVTKTELNKIDKDTSNKLIDLTEKHQKLELSLSNFQKEFLISLSALAATIQDSIFKNQNSVTSLNNLQPHNLLGDDYPSENTEPAYLTDYNAHQKNFADTYKSVVIDRDPDNYNLSRAGQTEQVILTEESRGNYWLFSYDGLTYVVPSQKLKIREDKLNEVKDLFDCENYQESNYDNYTLIKPALVSQKVNGNWRLKEKGVITFIS